MIAQLLRKLTGIKPRTSLLSEVVDPIADPRCVGRIAEHGPEEEQQRFIACDPETPGRRGSGALFANGDVVIQWHDHGYLEIPAGHEWRDYLFDWNREFPVY